MTGPHQRDRALRELRERVEELEARDRQRARAEAALRDWQRTLQLVMDHIPLGVFWKDREYRYLGCNRVFASDSGIESPEEIVGRHDFELAWVESAPRYREDDRAVMEEGRAKINYEEPMDFPDGSRKWVRTTKVPLRDHDGTVLGLFGCYEDITAHKAAEEAALEGEARFRTLFEEAAEGIFVSDAEGRYVDVNPAGCAMTGYTVDELRQLTVHDLVAIEDATERRIALDALRVGTQVFSERRLVHKDGSRIVVELTATALPDGRLLAMVRDVTERRRGEEERRRLEEELLHAQRIESLGRLAGGIAHDFNNLLTAILGSCDLLLRVPSDSARAADRIGEIREAAERAAGLTRQLLAFSRKQVVEPEIIDINRVVESSHAMLARLIGEDVELSVSIHPEPLPALVDHHQLEQVLVNLAVNARDAMPEGGTLRIETEASGGEVVLRVSDTGLGMDEQTQRHVFEPFFTTKERGKGTGLGLSTVYGIVTQAGGTLELASAPGEGTTFTIRLAREDGASRPNDTGAEPGALRSRGEVVLLVEDDDAVRAAATEMLATCGYEVLVAAGGEEALELHQAQGDRIDFLITDVIMPRMNGVQLAEALRARTPELPVLYVSGYTDEVLDERGSMPPGVQLLMKPFTMEELARAVRRVLGA